MSVNLQISSGSIYVEKRFDKGISLSAFKKRLEPITGIAYSQQMLSLYSGDNFIQNMIPFNGENEDSILLGAFYVEDGYRVQVQDQSGGQQVQKQYMDVSAVPKFEISEKEYEKRNDSILAFKKRNQLGQFSQAQQVQEQEEQIPDNMKIGDRCELIKETEVDVTKRGTIRFIGNTKFQKGIWVGIQLDEPYGKNNGSVQGERYFECLDKYGIFVKSHKVKVGDFPVQNIDFSDDELDEL